MELVQPIRDTRKIKAIKNILKAKNLRDYALFTLGINSGLRISDLLRLKVSDVLDEKGKIKDRISLREKKTGKFKDFPICETVRKALQEYLQDSQLGHGDYLFPSRKGRGPITRIQAYRVINDACRLAGVNEPVGTHTMRKTFGYHAYKRGLDLAIIQKMLNHSSPSTTLAYIGITQEDQDNVYMSLNL